MEQQGSGRGQVDLFNFSFLDILACVIGLLIFILTIVVISGGNPKVSRQAQNVARAEQDVREARFAAQMARQKRSELETLLERRATDAMDPAAAAASVEAETRLLSRQADEMFEATLKAEQQAARDQAEVAQTSHLAETSTAQATLLEKAKRLDADTALRQEQAALVRREKVKTTEVTYHVPRLTESSRRQIWAEVSGQRVWFLDSNAFDHVPHGDGFVYIRKSWAAGVAVDENGLAFVSDSLQDYEPNHTLIHFAVRPDGYAAFRKLREQAWARGYAVNWTPFEKTEQIILVPVGRVFQQ